MKPLHSALFSCVIIGDHGLCGQTDLRQMSCLPCPGLWDSESLTLSGSPLSPILKQHPTLQGHCEAEKGELSKMLSRHSKKKITMPSMSFLCTLLIFLLYIIIA